MEASSEVVELLEKLLHALKAGGEPAPADDDESPVRDLFSLANAIATMMDGAVAIEDPQSNLLAYSNLGHPIDEAREQTILARKNPDAWAARMAEVGIAQQLLSAPDGAIRIVDPLGKVRPRVAVLVRAGGDVLGSIWVVQGETPFGPDAETTLQDAAPLAALHLLRHRALGNVTRRRQGSLVRALLNGTGAGEGLRLEEGPCAVVAFAVADALRRDLVIDLVTVACEAYRRRVVCSWEGPVVHALFPAVKSVDGLQTLVHEICKRAPDVRAGIGSVVPALAEAQRSRGEAERAVRVPGAQVTSFEDVRVAANLLEVTDFLRSRPDLRLPVLATIAAEDHDGAKGHVATLKAFIAASGDIALTAELTHVHKNTVRYRLKRLNEVFGLDLLDPAVYLMVSLELRLG